MNIELRVFRFNPDIDQKPHFDLFSLDMDPNERILDALEVVRDMMDGSVAYRRSCAHAVCGSCAMRVNGRNALACKLLIKDVQEAKFSRAVKNPQAMRITRAMRITLEPLLGLTVLKDLVVDMDPFFEHFNSVSPYFINEQPLPQDGRERLQSPQERERFDDTTKCILCAACTTACPSFWANSRYVGPAAIVNAHRFIYDSRDRGAITRLRALDGLDGIWRCRTAFSCSEACPRDIHITRAIAEVKQAMQKSRQQP